VNALLFYRAQQAAHVFPSDCNILPKRNKKDDCGTDDGSTPDAWGNDTFKFQLSGAETRREREEA
jgi:hypothetical protein